MSDPMSELKYGVFVDVLNIRNAFSKVCDSKEAKLDFSAYLGQCANAVPGGKLYRAYAFGTSRGEATFKFEASLKAAGFQPCMREGYKVGDELKNFDWGPGMAARMVAESHHFDVAVIGSSNSSMVPVIELLKNQGTRVVILSGFVPRVLKDIADEVVNLTKELAFNKS